jgi:valyl-tRNA synthetase
VVTPMHLLEEHGADAVRYWAASGRPGTDTAFDPQQMKVGRRLAVKLLNASKFALADLPESDPAHPELTHPLDRAVIARLADVVADATTHFEGYDYARALERTETFFWWFCDYYLELVKGRRYHPDAAVSASVSRALRLAMSAFQRLLAPFLPFVCEEVWSWWREGSVHRASWPEAAELSAAAAGGTRVAEGAAGAAAETGAARMVGDPAGVNSGMSANGGADADGDAAREAVALEVTADVLREVRKAKSQAQVKMRAPVARVIVHDTPVRLDALELGIEDLREAGSIEAFERREAEEFAVAVELAEQVER